MLYHQSVPVQKNGKSNHYIRITALKKIIDKYNYDGMEFPADHLSIELFEERNQVCICVYELGERDNIVTSMKGNLEHKTKDIIYLLKIYDKDKSHYTYIKKVNSLFNLHHQAVDKDKIYVHVVMRK